MASPMAAAKMSSLSALRRQHLLAEFAGLKQACPSGVFVSLTPGDPSLWSGVIFVRKGPYATAVLRFQISFPDTFPSLPPLVTFSTDMFHPLITPLTTYMYTTDIQDGGTVSATDEERLPPGGFSLRHGFPDWFGRAARRSRQVSSPPQAQASVNTPPRPAGETGGAVGLLGSPPGSAASSAASDALASHARRRDISTFEVLRYIRSTFDDEDMLDSVPLEAAGNPGAWHAWRAHRRQVNATSNGPAGISPGAVRGTGTGTGKALPPEPSAVRGGGDRSGGGSTRRPGEWNWEGVWEERVKRGITTSLSEAVLYGNVGAADELINFLNMDESEVEGVKKNLLRTMGASI